MEKLTKEDINHATVEYLDSILTTAPESQKHTMEYNDLSEIFKAGVAWAINRSKEIERKKVIEDFSREICNLDNCPEEFIDIVNNNFWEMI